MHRLASFTFLEAVGRRLWHNYCWIFFIHVTSYVDKLLIHPTPISSVDEFFARATIGPVPGNVLASGERMCADASDGGKVSTRQHLAGTLVLRIERCREKAARCQENARQVQNPVVRNSYLRAAAGWTKIAEAATEELRRLEPS